jgi:hypothetical protein
MQSGIAFPKASETTGSGLASLCYAEVCSASVALPRENARTAGVHCMSAANSTLSAPMRSAIGEALRAHNDESGELANNPHGR